jgi:hypothetical protein
MIRLRPLIAEDNKVLQEIHQRQELGYPYPDTADPRYVVKIVAVDERGQVKAAGLLRITTEIFFMVDEDIAKEKKQEIFQAGLQDITEQAQMMGVDEVHAFIPPKMVGMGKVLEEHYGFEADWPCYYKELNNGKKG